MNSDLLPNITKGVFILSVLGQTVRIYLLPTQNQEDIGNLQRSMPMNPSIQDRLPLALLVLYHRGWRKSCTTLYTLCIPTLWDLQYIILGIPNVARYPPCTIAPAPGLLCSAVTTHDTFVFTGALLLISSFFAGRSAITNTSQIWVSPCRIPIAKQFAASKVVGSPNPEP